MNLVILAISLSVLKLVRTFLRKDLLKNMDYHLALTLDVSFVLVGFIPFFFIFPIPQIDFELVLFALAIGFLYFLSDTFYFKSFQKLEVSFAAPIGSLIIFSTVIFGFLLNQELPSNWGFLGVLLSILGVYILEFDFQRHNFFQPFMDIIRNRFVLIYILSMMAYGLLFSFDKIGITASSFWFWTFLTTLFEFLFLFFQSGTKLLEVSEIPRSKILKLAVLGFLGTAYLCLIRFLMTQTLVVYVEIFKTLEIILVVIFGVWFFKEQKLKQKLLASALIASGSLIIGFLG